METIFTKPYQLGRTVGSVALLLLSLLKPVFSQAQAGQVVISEVYAGGSATAVFRNDFVELYNKSNTAYSLTGYSVQYRGTGTASNFARVPLTGLTIAAHGYLLVQFGTALATGNPLPTPDASAGTNLSTTAGKVAVVNGTVALPGTATATTAGVIDFVGYGSTIDQFEGASPAVVTGGASIERKAVASSTSASMLAGAADALLGNGYDSQNNGQDFVRCVVPEPQNGASAPETAPTAFYGTKAPAGPVNDLATYSSTPDGSGPSPTSFSDDAQLFYVGGANRTLTGDLTVSGVGSRLVLEPAASLVVPVAFNYTGVLDLGDNATLTELNPTPGVVFNSIAASCTVEYAQATTCTVPVPSTAYGNLTLRNGTKLLSAGTTAVLGNFLADNVGASGTNVLGGTADSVSTLSLGGNFTLTGTVKFSTTATDRITLALTNTTAPQVIDGGSNTIKLFSLTTVAGQAGVLLADGASNLELGNAAGGGYNLAAGTVLTVGANTLSLVPSAASIGSGPGQLAVNAGSSLVFSKNRSAGLGTLRLTPTSTELGNLTVNATGTGGATGPTNALTLASSAPLTLTVIGTLTLANGSLGIGANNLLILNGPVVTATTGFLRGASTASLQIGGTGTLSPLRFVTGTLRNFTLNRAATYTMANSLTVSNAFTLSQGIFAINGSILTLNGTVTTGAGLLSGTTTSQLRIAGQGALGALAFAPSAGLLSALTLNRPGGTLTLSTSPVLITTVTHTAGVLGLGADVSLTINGALTVADPAVALFAGTPSSSLGFTGTGAIGALAFVPNQNVLNGLSLSRSSGAPTAQLLTDLAVKNLTLNNGRIFAVGNSKLIVLPGGSYSGGGINSYTNTLTYPAITNSDTKEASVTFPLGVNGQYRRLIFEVTDASEGTTNYTARQFEARSPARTLPPTLLRVSQIRYYNVVRESGDEVLLNAQITLSYDAATDGVTPANEGSLRVAMTDPADNSRWKDIGGTGQGIAGIQSASFPAGPLGDFTLATDIKTPPATNPLPVELVRFDASRQAAGVRLSWATASEKNSARFEVERSLNGQTFAAVAAVMAQGTSSQLHAYTALDAQAPAGRLYYRLRQVDLDGTLAYSSVVTVEGTSTAAELSVYPNPASDRLTAALPAAEGRTYRVLNGVGQVLDQGRAAAANPGVDVRRLPAGTYFLEFTSPAGRQVRRFVKND